MKENEMITDIRTVLIKDWDPIGIGENSALRDEYDGYIAPIIQILMHDPSIESIISFLKEIEYKDMGIDIIDTKCLNSTATKLIRIRDIYPFTINMIRIKAIIRLYKNGRKTPFSNGYRPLFDFAECTKTSGQINLIDRDMFYPGDEGIVEIYFLKDLYLGNNFSEGVKFTFGEGREPLGEGEIKEILKII